MAPQNAQTATKSSEEKLLVDAPISVCSPPDLSPSCRIRQRTLTTTIQTINPSKSSLSHSRKRSFANVADVAVYFFDSSALVKRYVQEAGTAWVRRLTRQDAVRGYCASRIKFQWC